MRMEPLCGAGMLRMLISGGEELLRRIWRVRRRREGVGRERGRIMVYLGGELGFRRDLTRWAAPVGSAAAIVLEPPQDQFV